MFTSVFHEIENYLPMLDHTLSNQNLLLVVFINYYTYVKAYLFRQLLMNKKNLISLTPK